VGPFLQGREQTDKFARPMTKCTIATGTHTHQSTCLSHQSNCVHPERASSTTLSAVYDPGRYVRNWELAVCSFLDNQADSTSSDASKGKQTKIHIKMEERMRKGYKYCVNSIVQHTHISIMVKYKSNSYKYCSVR